ncbi:peptidylprolyl isomerase [Ranunculus cassubicifolius]
MSVLVVTSLGDIVIDLHTDRCPLTTKNFLKLCKIKYFNGCLFHTIQKDFTAQTGDPTGKGSGGDSIYKFLYGDQARFFGDEIHPDLKHSKIGTVAMASGGENLNASQFYFTLRDDLDYLDGKHTVFGEVAEGLETLERINEAYVDEKNRPFKNIRIKHTHILDDPFDDPPQLSDLIPDASPEGKPKNEIDDDVRLEDDWVPMDEQLGQSELEEIIREKEAHSSAVVLESIGDIPEAEIKPPENVLFVCKLNPVTEDEDLNTIFSRFGTVVSADIIRDFKTGDSLCYAFIEFENKESCEQAYFKMDNALIDDRRIHVDFSQSVSRLWSQYRRKDIQAKGRGCFRCGALDHNAKECSSGVPSAINNQPPKYVLKEDKNARLGGRYEMVFDDDGREKGKREKHSNNERRESSRPSSRDEHGHGHNRRNEEYRIHHRDRREERDYRRNDRKEDRDYKSDRREDDRDFKRPSSRDENRDIKSKSESYKDHRDSRERKEERGDHHRRSAHDDDVRGSRKRSVDRDDNRRHHRDEKRR